MKTPQMLCVGVGLVALTAYSAAQAQFETDFENPPYSASAAGTLLTGQDGWFNPVAGSSDFNAYTYAGNAFGIALHPTGGGDQMVAGRWPGGTAFARAQHLLDFSAGGTWTATWDVLGMYNGALPAVENLGSFSLQDSATARIWQQVMQWGTNAPTATAYNINYGVWNTPPHNQAAPTFVSPGPAWMNIPVNNWIRQSTTWDFTSNRILSVSIQNLTLGTPTVTVDVSAQPYFLRFGPNGVGPLPTAIRIFTGGSGTVAQGNITAWDNIDVGPPQPLCPADISPPGGDGQVNVNDLLLVVGNWGATGRNPADVNNDNVVDVNDLLLVIGTWGPCP